MLLVVDRTDHGTSLETERNRQRIGIAVCELQNDFVASIESVDVLILISMLGVEGLAIQAQLESKDHRKGP